jgi:hypothetical protein
MAIKKAMGDTYKSGLESNTAILESNKKVVEIKAFTKDTPEQTRKTTWAEYDRLKAIADAKKKNLSTKAALLTATYADITDLKDKAKLAKDSCEAGFTAVSAQLELHDGVVDNYLKAVKDTQALLITFYNTYVQNTPDPLDNQYDSNLGIAKTNSLSAIANRNTEETALRKKDKTNAVLVALQPLTAAQNKFYETSIFAAFNQKMPKVVKLFYDFVTSKGIAPTDAFSPYAKSEWPAKPGEFYAEAYSFFITDPGKLKKFSTPLYEWFADGKYKE